MYIYFPKMISAEYIMRNAGLDKAQVGIKIARRNINNLVYADDITLMAESEEKLKSLLVKVKEESGKSWLKAQHSEKQDDVIWSHYFIANRWGNSRNSSRLYFWGLQKHCIGDNSNQLKDAYSLEGNLGPTRQHIKK